MKCRFDEVQKILREHMTLREYGEYQSSSKFIIDELGCGDANTKRRMELYRELSKRLCAEGEVSDGIF